MPIRTGAASPRPAKNPRRSPDGKQGEAPTHNGQTRASEDVLPGGDWSAWQSHFASRTTPRSLHDLAPGGEFPLLWAVPENCDSRLLALAGRIHLADSRARAKFLITITKEIAARRDDTVASAYLQLAYAHSLPHLAGAMQADEWRDALEQFAGAIQDSAALSLEDNPLGRLLWGGELPWTLAYLFPEIGAFRRQAESAEAVLSQGLLELLDGEGVLAAAHLPQLRPLLAMWTRCGLMGREANRPCFAGDAGEQFSWFVQRAVLLSRPDGAQLLSPDAAGTWRPELFEAALSLSGDPQDETLARVALPLPAKKRSAAAVTGTAPQPAFHSAWAEVGLLRRATTRDSARFLTTYGDRRLAAELTNRDEVVLSGTWDPHVEIDGQLLTPQGDWEDVCWVSDADMDYLELEMVLARGWRVQRQMLLARKDEFLFVADAVLGPAPGKIGYRCAAPLAAGANFVPERETQEGLLKSGKNLAVVLPLSLPEWRAERRGGTLAAAPAGLELKIEQRGSALFAPLFFDLARRRWKKPRTWRRLTVAERLEIQPIDIAVGFRVQVGTEQWLFYRSLAPGANRTVLGQNLSSEFVAARFTSQGTTEELVSISLEA